MVILGFIYNILLEKKCQTLVQDFDILDTKTQTRLNEVISSINKKTTKKDLENQEFELLDKLDEFKEELNKKLDSKIFSFTISNLQLV